MVPSRTAAACWVAVCCAPARAAGTIAKAAASRKVSGKRMSVLPLWRRGCGIVGGSRCAHGGRLHSGPVLQLRDPHRNRLVLAGKLSILLVVLQRGRRLVEIQVAQDTTVAISGRVSGIRLDRAPVRLVGILEPSREALRDAELGPGERVTRIAPERLLQSLHRGIELAVLTIENPDIHERRDELWVLMGDRRELRLRGILVTGARQGQSLVEFLFRLRRDGRRDGNGLGALPVHGL